MQKYVSLELFGRAQLLCLTPACH